MKNYKKIYKRLIKELSAELKTHEEIKKKLHKNTNTTALLEQIENNYGITMLNWVFEMLPEIEGKECHMIIMNQKEFKAWKRGILCTIGDKKT